MAKKFTYGDYSCELQSRQCIAMTKKGERCKRRTRRQIPYCADHTRIILHVEIRPSTIPGAGFGLFALQDFEAGERILAYEGQLIDKDELLSRYGDETAPYAFKISENKYVDGACARGTASFINTNPGRNNAALRAFHGSKTLPPGAFVKATKKIKAGKEIFVSYGADTRTYFGLEHKTD